MSLVLKRAWLPVGLGSPRVLVLNVDQGTQTIVVSKHVTLAADAPLEFGSIELADNTGVEPGMVVTGDGIPEGTTVLSVSDTSQDIALSVPLVLDPNAN